MRLLFRQHHTVKQCRKMYVSFLLWIRERIRFRYARINSPCLSLPVDFLFCAHPGGYALSDVGHNAGVAVTSVILQ